MQNNFWHKFSITYQQLTYLTHSINHLDGFSFNFRWVKVRNGPTYIKSPFSRLYMLKERMDQIFIRETEADVKKPKNK